MISANRTVCAFTGSWLVDGTRTRTSTPSLAAHPLLFYLVCIYVWIPRLLALLRTVNRLAKEKH
jgi:hypothetical protein